MKASEMREILNEKRRKLDGFEEWISTDLLNMFLESDNDEVFIGKIIINHVKGWEHTTFVGRMTELGYIVEDYMSFSMNESKYKISLGGCGAE
jgi:predicted P-loop ATPase/GTPase